MLLQFRSFVHFIVLLLCFPSFSSASNAQVLVKGGSFARIALSTQYQYIDNFLFDDSNKQKTSSLQLAPKIALQYQDKQQLYKLDTDIKSINYQQFSEDNTLDYSLRPAFHYKFTHNLLSYTRAQVGKVTEARGQGISYGEADTLSSPDERLYYNAETGLLLGSEYSAAKIHAALGVSGSQYQTRRFYSRVFDEQSTEAKFGFDYLLSGKSYLATAVELGERRYSNNELLNRKQISGLLGYKWHSTNITNVELLIGYEQLAFDSALFDDSVNFKWRVNVGWQPLSRFKAKMSSFRSTESSERAGLSYRVEDVMQTSFSYLFRDDITVLAGLNLKNNQYIYQNDKDEEQEYNYYLQLDYTSSEKMKFHLRYQQQNAKNSFFENDYHRASYSFGINVII